MALPLHHAHKRHKKNKSSHACAPQSRFAKILDKVIYIICISAPAMALPQVYKVWVEQNVAGISLFMFSGLALVNLAWIIYGITHKEKTIILVYICWVTIDASIAIGKIIFS